MISLPGYTVTEPLEVGKRTAAYRGIHDATSRHVVVKLPTIENPSIKEVACWRHAYEIVNTINLSEIVRHITTERFGSGIALITEDFGGESLSRLYLNRPLPIEVFLPLSIALTDAIGALHRKNIIHKNITPKHVLVHPKSGELKLTGFGQSTPISIQRQTVINSGAIESSLAYISPEQTGRMNRVLDSRSDLYSLGAVLYELLAGAPPFAGTEPLELIHAHIARRPVPPSDINSNVPSAISDIILKLLAKNAEDRYYSAEGLKADLESCQAQWQATHGIPSFSIGTYDMPDRLNVAQTLYGREEETEKLLGAFERIAAGAKEIVLVSGAPGIGKSSLIQELQKPVVKHRGFYIAGKTDVNRRSIPYGSLIQAFHDLIRQLLTWDSADIATWRTAIAAAVGENGKILTDVIPEVERIIGKPQALPALGPTETQNRFMMVFQKFIGVFATQEHPLVIFLDDMQWIDTDSLKLLRLLLTGGQQHLHLLIVGAYRENEVGPYHSLPITLEELRSAGIPITNIHLSPLNERETTFLIRDTFRCSMERAEPFGAMTFRKTGGNPFFINTFLNSLAQEGDVIFGYAHHEWKWDLGAIERRNVTDNVLDLILDKIHSLPQGTQDALAVAALIGNRFDLSILSHVLKSTEAEVAGELWQALNEYIIVPIDDTFQFVDSYQRDGVFGKNQPGTRRVTIIYKFSHDRVQQAVYANIPKKQAKFLHLEIGRAMIELTEPEQLAEIIYDVVNQFNAGLEELTDKKESSEVLRLNIDAGMRAKESTAFEQAFQFFNTAVSLSESMDWGREGTLLFEIHLQRGETAYMCGKIDEAETSFALCVAHAPDVNALAQVYAVKVQLSIHLNKYEQAFAAGVEGLRVLGVKLPQKVSKVSNLIPLLALQSRLRFTTTENLGHMSAMSDQKAIAALSILMNMLPSAYMKGMDMLLTIILKMMQLTLKRGNAPSSSYAYALYGLIIGSGMGNYRKGFEFGKLSLKIAERFNNKLLHGRANEVFGSAINHWRSPLRTNEPFFLEGLYECLESGDLVYADYISYFIMLDHLFSGSPLDQLEQFAKQHDGIKFGAQFTLAHKVGVRQFIRKMQNGVEEDDGIPGGKQFEVEALLHGPIAAHYNVGEMMMFVVLEIKSALIFGESGDAFRIARDSEKYLHALFGQYTSAEYSFSSAMAAAILQGIPGSTEDRKELKLFIGRHQKKLAQWAKNCPENFEHMSLLVAAECAAVSGDEKSVPGLYDRAIARAHESGFIHDEAFACERAARHSLSRKNLRLARLYLADARYAYLQWGATTKVSGLDAEFPEFLSSGQTATASLQEGESSGTGNLDAQTVIKSSRILSGQIILPRLLESLMQLVLESAGADRGVLLMETDGILRIETEGTVNPQRITVLEGIPVEDSHWLPLSLVNYVVRTGESIVLEDAVDDATFGNDPYIQTMNVHSVLCMPLINQGTISSVLYLENSLIPGAFTPERVEMLQVLAAQAAVSLTNARLYTQMEQYSKKLEVKVEERTHDLLRKSDELARNNLALEREKERSNNLLHNILPVEVARELMEHGTTTPNRYESVTVVMTDFKDFTQSASVMTPHELLKELNDIFGIYDDIVKRHGLEKVKTIGDAYMFAGGLPLPIVDHGVRCVRAALEMLKYLETRNAHSSQQWNMRVGIHTGPIVAGVVGKQKFTYDMWGDTVNIASRLETLGEAGKVNISASTYNEIKAYIPCVSRGKIPVKGAGEIEMYFVGESK